MSILITLIDLYSLVVFVSVVLSWFPTAKDNPVGQLVGKLTEPVLAPIRRVLPPLGGLDFSPLALLLLLRMITRLLLS